MSLDIWLSFEIETGNRPFSAEVYSGNYTHNVTDMWDKAGVYDALYMSDGKPAWGIIPALRSGVKDMRDNPDVYKSMNPENGWDDYKSALQFLVNVLQACEDYPRATIHIWK